MFGFITTFSNLGVFVITSFILSILDLFSVVQVFHGFQYYHMIQGLFQRTITP